MTFDYKRGYNQYRTYYLKVLPKIRSETTQTYLSLIMTLFTAAFFLAFAIRPTAKTILELKKTITDNQELNQKMTEKIANLSLAQKRFLELQPFIAIADTALPDEPQISELIKQLENLSLLANVKLNTFMVNDSPLDAFPNPQNIDPEDPKNISALQVVNFSLTAEGDYQSLEIFLKKLSRLARVISIQEAVIEKEQRKENPNSLNLSVKGETYYFLKNL